MQSKPLIRIAGFVILGLGLVVFGFLSYRDYSIKQEHSRLVREASQNEEEGAKPVPPAPDTSFALYLACSFVCSAGLAFMIAREVSQLFGQATLDFVFNDDLEGIRSPEYETAENEWNNGRYLDAIKLLRAYYDKHPREVYVALRIAEIYEKNLRNHLAAALEYEEILKKPLPAERWGWAAIHLVNLYSGKLNKPDQAMALLERIAKDYSQTGAAKKARVRLGLPEELPAEPAPAKAQTAKRTEPEDEEDLEPAPAPEPPSHLPKGFRPRAQATSVNAARPASEMVEIIKQAARDSGEPAPAPQLPPGFRPKGK